MGSVKDLIITRKPTKDRSGIGRFVFSDRYSVFDWGEMPDHIPHKGEALTLLSAHFFERLEQEGIRTHYRGIVTEGKTVRLGELTRPDRAMEVKLVRVIRPALLKDHSYDYAQFKDERSNLLIPLEIIYRNYLPEGSSFVQRVQSGAVLLKDYGLDKIPHPQDPLPHPIFDFSTKLEPTDRYLSPREAWEISGLKEEVFGRCLEILRKVNGLISRELTMAGLVNVDGKIELGLDEKGEVQVLDALGTPDECRFYYQGFHVSKEVARIFYRKTEWYKEVDAAKKKDRENWKALVAAPPPPLPQELRALMSHLYASAANTLTGRAWFPETPELSEVVRRLIEGAF